METGLILQGEKLEALEARRYLDAKPDGLIVDLPHPTSIKALEILAEQPVNARIPTFPMVHMTGATPEIAAIMVEQAYEIFGTPKVYFAFVPYISADDYFEKFWNRCSISVSAVLCGTPGLFLNEAAGDQAVRNLLIAGVDCTPCLVVSDTMESRKIWSNPQLPDFLERFHNCEFHFLTIHPGSYDYTEALQFNRPIWFYNLEEYQILRAKQRKEFLQNAVAIGTAKQDRVTVYKDVACSVVVGKLNKSDSVRIVQFLTYHGRDIVATTENVYIGAKYLEIEPV